MLQLLNSCYQMSSLGRTDLLSYWGWTLVSFLVQKSASDNMTLEQPCDIYLKYKYSKLQANDLTASHHNEQVCSLNKLMAFLGPKICIAVKAGDGKSRLLISPRRRTSPKRRRLRPPNRRPAILLHQLHPQQESCDTKVLNKGLFAHLRATESVRPAVRTAVDIDPVNLL